MMIFVNYSYLMNLNIGISFIAEAIDELYFELGIMRDRGLTPKDFWTKS